MRAQELSVEIRYEIGDPRCKELIETAQTYEEALRVAAAEALRRAYVITIYDRMARRGAAEEYAIAPDGHAAVTRVRAGASR